MRGTEFLPVSREEMLQRDWYYYDFLVVTADAYIDHPSFGTTLIARMLEGEGYRVAILAQPDWHDAEAFRAMGRPRYGVLIGGGNLDSMVAHYTVAKRRRDRDLYSPGGKMGPTTSQYAAIEALRNGDEDVAKMRESYDERRRFLVKELREMGMPCFEPMGAFYVFPNISRFGMTSEEFAKTLLEKEHVAVVPGSAFGTCGEGFLRISYAYSIEDLKKALVKIQNFIDTIS